MSKVKNISGFPELLPEQRLVEEGFIDKIRSIYRSYGFTPIETPAVELKSTLSSKGVIDKEIYVLRRALKDPNEKDDEELALHFDLTVPFARYVGQHYNELQFPLKRYQLQKVWRGERPQKGRFREFYQFDIDIIARETLPIACDAEILSAIHKVFTTLSIGDFQIKVNNRKILTGLYESLGLNEEQRKATIIVVDKLDKIGTEGVEVELRNQLKLSDDIISKIIAATKIRVSPHECSQALDSLNCSHEQFLLGKEEILRLFELAPKDKIVFDLSLARGLDYYTGSIFETVMTQYPEFGSVCSGGRYEDLAGQFINKKLPGVGVSIGLSRLMDLVFKNNLAPVRRTSPTTLLITVIDEAQRVKCCEVAEIFRNLHVPTEIYPASPKLGKQIEYADSKGIPFVGFIDHSNGSIKIKDLATKDEETVHDIATWCDRIRNVQ